MPDEILEIVRAGVEVAKNPPRATAVDKRIEAIPMSSDPDEAREQWNKPLFDK